MSAFTGQLTLTELDADWRLWQLESPLRYEVGELGSGRIIEVTPPFITDGASIPQIFWNVLPPWGRYSRAAVIHDYLGKCFKDGVPHPLVPDQKTADGIFLEAMGVLKVGWLTRYTIWLALRLADRFPLLRRLGVHDKPEIAA